MVTVRLTLERQPADPGLVARDLYTTLKDGGWDVDKIEVGANNTYSVWEYHTRHMNDS